MGHHPVEPTSRHVWVLASGEHGPPAAGVVVAWQHAPVHNVNAAAWLALVVTTPFEDALGVAWVGAERLVELLDASRAMPPPSPGRRHVWVDCSGGYQCPGLVMAWRREPTGWQAQVAVVRQGAVFVQWVPAATLHPVVDDGWAQGP